MDLADAGLSAIERLREVAAILATISLCLLRLRAPKKSARP
jgi:hypothetical protein